jgi:hypothetical protein
MKKLLLVVPLAVFLLAGCMVAPGPQGFGLVMVPALPSVVVLETEPYYYQSGSYYYYQNDRWSYSHAKSGPWADLPRDRYPKAVTFKHKSDDRGKDDKRGQDQRNRD